ncbi:hypothetical protein CEXT_261391 [Caerostris extrusa]|uniref:Uncharacterized protein n=1 Tax=Caerostris extrusa TaxID=172846 RepID=A0AAV4U0E9_CAEEX|nr:hypothetical protein CEXT_261391 [Caerostris extrusa]
MGKGAAAAGQLQLQFHCGVVEGQASYAAALPSPLYRCGYVTLGSDKGEVFYSGDRSDMRDRFLRMDKVLLFCFLWLFKVQG